MGLVSDAHPGRAVLKACGKFQSSGVQSIGSPGLNVAIAS